MIFYFFSMVMPSHGRDSAKSCHLIFLSCLSETRSSCMYTYAVIVAHLVLLIWSWYTHTLTGRVACVRACGARRTGKWPRAIGTLRSTVRWCVTRSESEWRNGVAYRQPRLVCSRGNRSIYLPPAAISADRRPRNAY